MWMDNHRASRMTIFLPRGFPSIEKPGSLSSPISTRLRYELAEVVNLDGQRSRELICYPRV